MAKFSIAIQEDDAGATVWTWEKDSIAVAQMQRILDWVWNEYGARDKDGELKTRTATRQQRAFNKYARSAWQGTRDNALRHEEVEAVKTARGAVPGFVEPDDVEEPDD